MEYDWNVKRLLDWTARYFSKISRSPRLDAEILLGFVLKKSRLWLYTHFDFVPAESSLKEYREFVKRRAEGVPVHHITQKKSFLALEFQINENVLVPRPETEELVEKVLSDSQKNSYSTFVDVGCGSGVIAVSIAKYLDNSEVWAVDVSDEAMKLTEINASKHGVSKKVHVVKYGEEPMKPDVVVSNPPYLTQHEWEMLEELHREPYEALVGGKDGNEVYKAILKRYSPKRFYFEIAHPFRKSLKRLLENMNLRYRILKDMANKDRILIVER